MRACSCKKQVPAAAASVYAHARPHSAPASCRCRAIMRLAGKDRHRLRHHAADQPYQCAVKVAHTASNLLKLTGMTLTATGCTPCRSALYTCGQRAEQHTVLSEWERQGCKKRQCKQQRPGLVMQFAALQTAGAGIFRSVLCTLRRGVDSPPCRCLRCPAPSRSHRAAWQSPPLHEALEADSWLAAPRVGLNLAARLGRQVLTVWADPPVAPGQRRRNEASWHIHVNARII